MYLHNLISIFLLTLVLAQSNLQQLTNSSMENLAAEQAEAETRKAQIEKLLTALDNSKQQGTSDEPSSAAKEKTSSTPADDAPKKSIQRVGPRKTEASFARVPVTELSRSESNYTRMMQKLPQLSSTQAAERLRQFVQDFPEHNQARLHLARNYTVNGKPDQALSALQPLLANMHQGIGVDWQPWFWAGTAYLNRGQLDQAREHLQRALNADTDNPHVWVQLAVVEQEAGHHAASIQYLNFAEEIAPGLDVIYLNRAYSLERVEDVSGATTAYHRYLTSDSSVDDPAARSMVVERLAAIAGGRIPTGQ
ncbi:MAG: tetratricopeptide repeat protein [Pseudomonadota bacterium]